MARKNISRDVLKTVNRKTKKNVSPNDIQKLASKVKPSTVKSETHLRKLIKQVSNVAKVPVSESTVKEIVSAVKKSGMNPQQMESMMKMMMKKK